MRSFMWLLIFSGIIFCSFAVPIVKIDGSSTVYPITEAVAEEFQIAQRGKIRVTVGISGTGGGFKKFCRGDVDITSASRPIRKKEMEICKKNGIKYIELPIAFDAISVVVNKKNGWVDCMTMKDLKRIWNPQAQGKIKRWNQVRKEWPNKPLKLCGPGVDSGTFDYFTKAVNGKEGASRGDYLASEDDNVLVQFVSREKSALCYFGLAYYMENRNIVKVVAIKNPKTGKCVKPSPQTVIKGEYVPLSRPVFIYVNADKLKKRKELREFVEFYIKVVSQIAEEVGYVPLPKRAYELTLDKVKKLKTGTAFSGESKVGVNIEELIKAETKE